MNMPAVGGTKLNSLVPTEPFSDIIQLLLRFGYASYTTLFFQKLTSLEVVASRCSSSERQSMNQSRRVLYWTARPCNQRV